ncbi:AmmeMemoRadiSam system radical SAM enzyme [Candidatus Woesearchaeota archaeon]|nr:AmmeMemoRadiSam system radical SAM enzyme [Candidatus Woesearchaeota archaeon]
MGGTHKPGHKSHNAVKKVSGRAKKDSPANHADSFLKQRISRRDFLKKAAIGAGGLAIGAYAVNRLMFSKGSHDLRATSHTFPGDAPDTAWKWSKEAFHYETRGRGATVCMLCPNHCRLSPGDRGICRARVNIGGKLYSLTYGNPCSVNVDPIEKKPLYHFLPTTKAFSIACAGCNMRCLNCQNWQISQSRPEDTRNTEMFPEQVVSAAAASGSRSIAYTYSEPSTFFEYMHDTSRLARAQGIRNVWVTSGYINPEPLSELCEYLDAANVDLKSFSEDIYSRLNAGSLRPVLETLKLLKEKNVWQEITWLAVPTWTDDMNMIREGMEWVYKNLGPDYPVHFSRFNPLHKLTHLPATPVKTLENAREIALDVGIHHVYIGNVPGHEAENTYCPHCGKTVIKRRGYNIDLSNFESGTCKACGESISGVWK